MEVSIDVHSTNLDALQKETRQMVENGEVTLEQWRWFNNLSKAEREILFDNYEKLKPNTRTNSFRTEVSDQVRKFALLVDFGIITVSDNYVHSERLATFRTLNQNHGIVRHYSEDITDWNFPNKRRILKPGERYHVRAFKQVYRGFIQFIQCWVFLYEQNAVFTGAQGVSLVVEACRNQMLKNVWFLSFDSSFFPCGHEEGTVFSCKVPSARRNPDNSVDFEPYRHPNMFFRGDSALLCFTEVK